MTLCATENSLKFEIKFSCVSTHAVTDCKLLLTFFVVGSILLIRLSFSRYLDVLTLKGAYGI